MSVLNRLNHLPSGLLAIGWLLFTTEIVGSQIPPSPTTQAEDLVISTPPLELSPELINSSPVLQRWLESTPNVWEQIQQEPSFRTRWRLGYSQFSEAEEENGLSLGVEDLWMGDTPFTLSGNYYRNWEGDRQTWGADLRYYVLPLGSYVNISPVVGYRQIEVGNQTTDGINLGMRLLLSLSRSGAADLSLTQTFVSPGDESEVGITNLSVGYALTNNLRIATDIEQQNSRSVKDRRLSILLEWMP